MIKCIIFDWGGVCTESHLIRNFSKSLGGEFDIRQEVVEKAFIEKDTDYELGRITSEDFWVYFAERLGINKERARKVFIETQNVNNEVTEFVKSLKKNFLVVLLTNNYHDLVQNIKSNYYDFFHYIYASNELGIKKPDKQIYKRVLDDLSLAASECIFVDDKEKNLTPADELGMNTILFTDFNDLKNNIDMIVRNNKKL